MQLVLNSARHIIAVSKEGGTTAIGVSRALAYRGRKDGVIRTKKFYGRTIVLVEDLREMLRGLPYTELDATESEN